MPDETVMYQKEEPNTKRTLTARVAVLEAQLHSTKAAERSLLDSLEMAHTTIFNQEEGLELQEKIIHDLQEERDALTYEKMKVEALFENFQQQMCGFVWDTAANKDVACYWCHANLGPDDQKIKTHTMACREKYLTEQKHQRDDCADLPPHDSCTAKAPQSGEMVKEPGKHKLTADACRMLPTHDTCWRGDERNGQALMFQRDALDRKDSKS